MKPTARLLTLLAALLALSLALEAWPLMAGALPAWLVKTPWALLGAALLIAIIDALWLRRLPLPKISRQLPGNLPLGRWSEAQLSIRHRFSTPLTVEVFDHSPASMERQEQPQSVQLLPNHNTQLSYRLKPLQRGHYHWQQCELLLPSPLHFWQRKVLQPLASSCRVLPDFAHLYGSQLNAVDQWLLQLGVQQKPRRGLGQEFHQLREYQDGDSLKQIDWKATARKHAPIARQYQDERDQQVIFMLDCGRRMRSQDDELAHFDHALNACLLLSHTALRQGDAVGLSTFACEHNRYLPPAKGHAQLNALISSLYDIHSSQLAADYLQAARALLTRQRRRALVVILTNLRDDDEPNLLSAIKQLSRQHQVLVASLREPILDEIRQKPVSNYDQALNYCGALEYLNLRNQLHERLQALKVPVVECRPHELGPQLVSRYLAMKKSAVL